MIVAASALPTNPPAKRRLPAALMFEVEYEFVMLDSDVGTAGFKVALPISPPTLFPVP